MVAGRLPTPNSLDESYAMGKIAAHQEDAETITQAVRAALVVIQRKTQRLQQQNQRRCTSQKTEAA